MSVINSDYSPSTYIKSSDSKIDWTNPQISEGEKKVIGYWVTTSDDYRYLLNIARNIGQDITRADICILRDSHSRSQSGLNYVQKLRNVIHFAYYNNTKLGGDSFLFDMWATWALGYDFKINSLTKDIEQQGKVIDPSDLYHDSWLTFRRALGFGLSEENKFISLLLNHLRDDKVNPWLARMDKVNIVTPEMFMTKHGFDPHRLCEHITGDDRELQQFLWLVQFIGLMARTYKPGCQHDHLLVLMSEEKGKGKSTFLKELMRDPNIKEQNPKTYLQLRSLKSDKKDTERLRGKVLVNIDECDSAFRGTNADDLKETITCTTDNYRASYGRVAKDWERTCVLFGTTNTPGLIQDYSGDRRIFIVQVKRPFINLEWIKENLEDFWGFYKWAYQQMVKGNNSLYRNWLNKTEEALLVANQTEYKAREPWLDTLEGVMGAIEQTYPSVAIKASDLLAVLSSEIESKKRYIADHIKDILKAERGYKEGRPRPSNAKQPGKPVLYLLYHFTKKMIKINKE